VVVYILRYIGSGYHSKEKEKEKPIPITACPPNDGYAIDTKHTEVDYCFFFFFGRSQVDVHRSFFFLSGDGVLWNYCEFGSATVRTYMTLQIFKLAVL